MPGGRGVVPTFRYRAFLCYSHRDKRWADWLHAALETYRVPRHLVGRTTDAGEIPRRLAPVFRDRDELPSATDLSRKVNEALEQSANLVVICPPNSAASRWVNKEVLAFKRLGRAERIFCLIIAGEPNATDSPEREALECFAPALRYRVGSDGQLGPGRTEPIAADVRPGKDGKSNAKLKLISGLLDAGFDELRQRELHRRHRRMTAVAAVATAITVLTAALAIEAVIARRAAERHQKQAEDLVGFMLGDLNGKLEPLQRLDILEAVDDRAMRYFKSLPSSDVTEETLVQRARALEKIGSVRAEQGHLQAALDSYQSALALAAGLARAAPANARRQLAYANDWAWIGMTYWSLGRLEAAGKAFAAAQRVLARASRDDPRDTDVRFEEATLDNDIGHVLEAEGRLEEAAVHYRSMLAVSQGLVAQDSGHKEWAVELGSAHNNLGKAAMMRGDLTGAIAEYRADDALETMLSERDSRDNDQLENSLRSRAILGRTLALAGDLDAGILDLTQSIQAAERLTAFDPRNTTFQEDRALYESQLARMKRLAGDLRPAAALTARSLQSFAALTAGDPGNTQWSREYAEAQTEEAAESLAEGHAESARSELQEALARLEPLLARQPEERALLLATTRARLQLAAVSADAGAARQLRTEALAAIDSVKSGRADPRLLALRSEALLGLGRAADAQPALVQLAQSGYRDRGLLSLLQRAHIDYPTAQGAAAGTVTSAISKPQVEAQQP
ncbi:MAG: toll/interleukin-1 receptor domain-containing protein [Gammaproteobacteria bacterium]|nr:toll/interleukin-1 receptor domain-containing protein [Gammaproteobacteria bacterium]